MATLAAKERTEVAKEIQKLQQLGEGDSNPHIQQLHQQCKLLLDGHNQLVSIYNENFPKIDRALLNFEARLGAIQLALDDFFVGGKENVTLRHVQDTPVGVHWEGYSRLYLEKMKEFAEEEAARAAQEKRDAALHTPEAPLENADGDEDTTVFGGDVVPRGIHEVQPEQSIA